MTLQDFLNKTYCPTVFGMQKARPWIFCNDGFFVSVQAGDSLYCSPRVTGLIDYSEVELGFPSEEDELIMEYAENPEKPCDTVYGYVPVEIVEKLIAKHGGFMPIDQWQEAYILNNLRKPEWDLKKLFGDEG